MLFFGSAPLMQRAPFLVPFARLKFFVCFSPVRPSQKDLKAVAQRPMLEADVFVYRSEAHLQASTS